MFDPQPQHNIWSAGQHMQSGFSPVGMVSAFGAQRSHMDLPPQKAESIAGYGQLTWLSAKAGLITCKNRAVMPFQIKDFCDQLLTDLTSVLRVGFTLAFQASLNESNDYTVTMVSPLYGPEAAAVFADAGEVDLEAACPIPPNLKDAFDPMLEIKAIPALLSIFQRHGLPAVQLSSLHSQMSNCGDDELYRYVGTSSLKRRQFVERRTHLFVLRNDDTVQLQYPAVYLCVLRLASYMLRHGGATAIQSLYDYYTGPDMAPEIRDFIGDGRVEFLNLIQSHPWVFAIFPNRIYVSVRRNLPHIDYPNFIKKVFPKLDTVRTTTNNMQFNGGQAGSRTMVRSMSAHQPLGSSYPDRMMSLFQQEPIQMVGGGVPLATTPRDTWSPLSTSSWSRGLSELPASVNSVGGVIGSLPQAKQTATVGVQTEPMRNDSTSCCCGCSCGGRIVSSRGSGSPPSLESTSPSTGDRLSPGSGPTPLGDRVDVAPMKYYDPFGTDLLGGLTSFHLN